MAQQRTLLDDTGALMVERVVSHAASGCWSMPYQALSRRLVLPISGVTQFQLDGDVPLVLDSVSMLSLPDGLPYRMFPCAGAPRASIVVSATTTGPALLEQAGLWVLQPRAIWRLRRHWRLLAAYGAEVAVQQEGGTGGSLAAALACSAPAPRAAGRSAAVVVRAQRFMAGQVESPDAAHWTLQDVADAACCSLFHLARQFRRHTGVSLHGYRQRLRVAQALLRMEQGERDLAGLAALLGYSSQSHMGSFFQAELGVTPARARQLLSA